MNTEDKIVDQFDMNRIRRNTKLPIFCVYEHPTDYPDKYVARLWNVDVPMSLITTADTLEEIREKRPVGMVTLHRYETDDPAIVETWI